MKNLCFTLLLLFVSLVSAAQSYRSCFDVGSRSLFGDSGPRYHPRVKQEKLFRWYADAAANAHLIEGQAVPGVQLGAGLVYRNFLSGGLVVGQLLNDFRRKADWMPNRSYSMRYMGAEAQITVLSEKVFSFSFPIQYSVVQLSRYTTEGGRVVSSYHGDLGGLLTLGGKAEVNINPCLKLGVSAHYRLPFQTNLLTEGELRGAYAQMGLRYTWR